MGLTATSFHSSESNATASGATLIKRFLVPASQGSLAAADAAAHAVSHASIIDESHVPQMAPIKRFLVPSSHGAVTAAYLTATRAHSLPSSSSSLITSSTEDGTSTRSHSLPSSLPTIENSSSASLIKRFLVPRSSQSSFSTSVHTQISKSSPSSISASSSQRSPPTRARVNGGILRFLGNNSPSSTHVTFTELNSDSSTESALFSCSSCGQAIKLEERQEHSDFHLALSLQNGSN